MGTERYGAGLRQSGPLGKRGFNEPPQLAEYSDEPMFDLATMVQMVGVRPATLWAWEQQLNIRHLIHSENTGPSGGRRYSERDLRATTWLRDQIMAGRQPAEAAERLAASQPGGAGQSGAHRNLSSPPGGGAPATRPFPPPPRWSEASAPNWAHERPAGESGAHPRDLPQPAPGTSGSLAAPVPIPRPVTHGLERGGSTSSSQWPANTQAAGRELRSLVPSLVRALCLFDTYTADRIMNEALAVRPLETACIGLLLPALARVSETASRREAGMPEERFAATYVRARLYQVFASTQERFDGPLVTVACGPREWHDIGALTLATFWRRAGMRVVFLGQDMEGEGLVADSRLRHPRLVCVSIMSPQRLRALARIAKDINQIEAPTPLFSYSVAIFARNPELRRRVAGTYLGDDPASATWQALRLLSAAPQGAHGDTGQAG
jgi:DNA-binding transcriptional MerR regulator